MPAYFSLRSTVDKFNPFEALTAFPPIEKEEIQKNLDKYLPRNFDQIPSYETTTGGTSDARFIKKISPCLEFGLVNKTMHKVDECVSLSDLSKLTKIYHNILLEYFK